MNIGGEGRDEGRCIAARAVAMKEELEAAIRDEVHRSADLRSRTNEEMHSEMMTLFQEARAWGFAIKDESSTDDLHAVLGLTFCQEAKTSEDQQGWEIRLEHSLAASQQHMLKEDSATATSFLENSSDQLWTQPGQKLGQKVELVEKQPLALMRLSYENYENRIEKIFNEELAAQLNELLRDKIEKEENIKIMKYELAVLRQQLNAVITEEDKTKKPLDKGTSDKQVERNTLTGELDALRRAVGVMEGQNYALSMSLRDAETRFEELNQNNLANENCIKEMGELTSALLKKLRAEADALRQQVDTLVQEKDSLLQDKLCNEKSIRELTAELDDMEEYIAKERASVMISVKEAHARFEELRQDNIRKEEAKKKLTIELDSVHLEMDRLKRIIKGNSVYNKYATAALDDSLEKIDMVDKEFLVSQKVADLRYEALRNDKVKMQDAIKGSATDEIYEGLLSIHRCSSPSPPQTPPCVSSFADELRMFPFIHVQESGQILSQPNPKGFTEQAADLAASLQETEKRQMLKSLFEKADLAAFRRLKAAPFDTKKDDRLQDTHAYEALVEATLLC
jgi:predicted  nucleic acid-binding Zn-ribbon protein